MWLLDKLDRNCIVSETCHHKLQLKQCLTNNIPCMVHQGPGSLTQVPGNDVNNFPTAFRVNRLIEAFQQVQVSSEADSPNITDTCHAHPTQPLAIYCDTCRKQLCRDCVLITQEHTSHKYSFFKEVAPKHREKILNELSIIENQESSILSTLGEIAAVESRVNDHAQKHQKDIDYAFEEMFANLQKYQQKMKADAAAYYNSLDTR